MWTGIPILLNNSYFSLCEHTLQKKKQAVEDGRQEVEKSLQEGNDVLNAANKLANEIGLAVEVSVLSSSPDN